MPQRKPVDDRTRLQSSAWKAYPHTFAQIASGGHWKAYSWIRYLSLEVTKRILAGNARILLSAPPQHGKLLAHNTPVLTADGWKRHGDLKVGDLVVHTSGRFIRVLALSPDGEANYRVRLTNGDEINCHGRHEWTVVRDRKRGYLHTLETHAIAASALFDGTRGTRGFRYRFQLPFTAVLEGVERALPVKPYTLGAWLGVANINRRFRHKRIPEEYLTASINQRLELLAGLIDTDGYVYPKNGRHVFTTAESELADSFCELLSTFGWNYSRVKEMPKLSSSGIQGKREYWVVGFNPDRPIPCRLPRNQIFKRAMRKHIAIESITKLDQSITGRCIQVDSSDGLYLVGRSMQPTHNSEFFSNWLPTWFLHNFPKKKVILGTYSQDYANKWGAKVRENLTDNPISRIPMRGDTASKKRFMTAAGGQMMVAGVDGPATGEGADFFCCDDPYKNYQEAMSPVTKDHIMEWFRSVANTRLQSGGSIVVMHTRWTESDMIGELAREDGWVYINLEAVCEHPELDPLGRKIGEPLCPERYTAEDLKQKRKDVTDLFWFPMFQGSPTNLKGSIVTADDIRYYDESPADKILQMDELGIFADLTYEKDEENDYSVFELWGRKDANIFLIAQIREQMGIPEQMDAFIRMCNDYPDAFHKEIEKKANGAAVIQLCEDKIPGIVANNPLTSKGARLAAVSPLYKAHNVWYPNPERAGNEWVKNNVYEITRMTLAGSKAKYDDTVDVASIACNHFGRFSSAIARLDALCKR